MNSFYLPFLLISAWLASPLIAQFQLLDGSGNPVSPTENISLELQIVALPASVAFPLIHDLKDAGKAEAAYQQIQKLLAEGEGKLIGWPMATSVNGQQLSVEEVDEIRYATAYDAGAPSVYLTVPEGQVLKELKEIRGLQLQGVPTSFESRDVGITLSGNVLSLDGKVVEMNIVAQHTRLKGMTKVTIESESTKEKMVVEQPGFDTKKITTSLRTKSGERTLLGVFKTSEPPDHLELFILKAEIKKVE